MIAALPVAMYGFILLMAALAYILLQYTIIAQQGKNSPLAVTIGRDGKGKLSLMLYFSAIPLAFISPWASIGCYVVVALLWLVPDKRIESLFDKN